MKKSNWTWNEFVAELTEDVDADEMGGKTVKLIDILTYAGLYGIPGAEEMFKQLQGRPIVQAAPAPMAMPDLLDIIESNLGTAVRDQFAAVVEEGESLDDQNENAIGMAVKFLKRRDAATLPEAALTFVEDAERYLAGQGA